MNPRRPSHCSTSSASSSRVYYAMFDGRIVTERGRFQSANFTWKRSGLFASDVEGGTEIK